MLRRPRKPACRDVWHIPTSESWAWSDCSSTTCVRRSSFIRLASCDEERSLIRVSYIALASLTRCYAWLPPNHMGKPSSGSPAARSEKYDLFVTTTKPSNNLLPAFIRSSLHKNAGRSFNHIRPQASTCQRFGRLRPMSILSTTIPANLAATFLPLALNLQT